MSPKEGNRQQAKQGHFPGPSLFCFSSEGRLLVSGLLEESRPSAACDFTVGGLTATKDKDV